MSIRPGIALAARMGAVLAIGALALHHLSYLAAHGGGASEVLAGSGHGYLALIAPAVIVAAAGLAVAGVAIPVLNRRRLLTRSTFESRAVGLAAAMLALFVAQELAEALVMGGSASAALLAGGWLTMPLALVLGALGSFALAGLAAVSDAIVRERPSMWRRRRSAVRALPPAPSLVPLPAHALAFGFARRPPPYAA
ncbi:MAG: hypothetical protein ACR2N5_02330 [Solirubrobacterales bacterium]